jgi:hypothetical protein
MGHLPGISAWSSVYCRGMVPGAQDPEGPPQGWFVDPFGVHEQRWFSQGRATALVRDGKAETQDPPPDGPVPEPLVRATAAPPAGRPSDDVRRAGGSDDPDPQNQFDFFGNPALPGTVGMAPALPLGGPAMGGTGGLVIDPMDLGDAIVAPARQLRHRWFALGGAVVWSVLVALVLFHSTTTVSTPTGHRNESIWAADPGASIVFLLFLLLCCAVTGVSFVRRVRAESDRWSRSGAACAGLIGVLGIPSLATVGLSFIFLAILLLVVARPIRRPRPLPGERVIAPAPKVSRPSRRTK